MCSLIARVAMINRFYPDQEEAMQEPIEINGQFDRSPIIGNSKSISLLSSRAGGYYRHQRRDSRESGVGKEINREYRTLKQPTKKTNLLSK